MHTRIKGYVVKRKKEHGAAQINMKKSLSNTITNKYFRSRLKLDGSSKIREKFLLHLFVFCKIYPAMHAYNHVFKEKYLLFKISCD